MSPGCAVRVSETWCGIPALHPTWARMPHLSEDARADADVPSGGIHRRYPQPQHVGPVGRLGLRRTQAAAGRSSLPSARFVRT